MQPIRWFFFIVVVFLAGTSLALGQCAKSYTDPGGNPYISRVQLVDIDQTSLKSDYTDYTATQSTELTREATYTLTLSTNGDNDYAVYIDWNGNNDLTDDGTEFTADNETDGTETLMLTVPADASLSQIRMRIIVQETGMDGFPDGELDACDPTGIGLGFGEAGEAEDYELDIQAALPISLLSFRATLANFNQSVYLKWVTISETDNDYFTVERSRNTRDWEVVGTVDGGGTTLGLRVYDFFDENPPKGVVYYRLKQTDYNGTSAYKGGLELVTVRPYEAHHVAVYPNPVTAGKDFAVESNEKAVASVNLLGLASGRWLQTWRLDADGQLILTMPDVPPGFYGLWIILEDGSRVYKKLIVR